ncbi:MAG: 5'/3'-nucleotidase SurE [Planctomycetota bacterium]|jgi:5'-nucleotidase|nr:5'/3'-nucleotidase SurE [Planctomycetota bacterium]MDP6988492.1 5'/3'-nucleotidase SurE [Planctomycetota bacterium]
MNTPDSTAFRRPMSLVAAAALVLVPAALPLDPRPAAPSEGIARILVTNDDGWDADGLAALVTSLAGMAEVVVCAPLENRSGASHSTEILRGDHGLRRVEVPGASHAWAVEGTPSDAVTFGLACFAGERGFDLVVSGVNAGANVGEISHYSGTVGAAMEAAGQGYTAIAVSQEAPTDFEAAARFTARLARRVLARRAPEGVVYSVNVPRHRGEGPQPVVVAPMGGRYVRVESVQRFEDESGELRFRTELAFDREAPEGSDTAAYFSGAITVTPLRFDWTDRAALERVGGWELGEGG